MKDVVVSPGSIGYHRVLGEINSHCESFSHPYSPHLFFHLCLPLLCPSSTSFFHSITHPYLSLPPAPSMSFFLSLSCSSLFLNKYFLLTARFATHALHAHNQLRSLHNAKPLVLNMRLCKMAESHARFLADNEIFEHSTQDERKHLEYVNRAGSHFSFRELLYVTSS